MCYVNPGSRLDTYEHQIGLPYGIEDPFPRYSAPMGMDASYLHAAFYFLSEIRIRQTLNKSKEARKAGKNQLNMDLM